MPFGHLSFDVLFEPTSQIRLESVCRQTKFGEVVSHLQDNGTLVHEALSGASSLLCPFMSSSQMLLCEADQNDTGEVP